MEEILASIRRIITDDEAGQAKAQHATAQAQSDDDEGEADSQIIDDIARVLSGGAEAPANEEEEILDLTSELGGLEIVEDDDGDAVFEVDEVEELVEVLELEEVVEFAEPEPDFVDASTMEMAPPEPPAAPEYQALQEPAQDMMPPQMTAPEPPVPAAPEPVQAAQPKQSAGEEAASALERAIAALRAGQVPTSTTPQAEPFQFQAAPQPEAMVAPEPEQMAEPEPLPMAVPMEEFAAEGETHAEQDEPSFETEPEVAPTLEPMAEAEQEPELMLTGVEVTAEAEMVEDAEPEAEKPPFWPAEARGEEEPVEPEPVFEPESSYEPEPEPVAAQPVAAQVNGSGAHHDVAGRTLEDSIKDMLRPMLRQWLDDNMPRMIRDELDSDPVRRHQD